MTASLVARLLISWTALLTVDPAVVSSRTVTVQSGSMAGLANAMEMIRDLLERGRGIEAENVARALLARVESLRGRHALEVADVLDLLGRAIRRSPNVSEQEKTELAERALAIKEKALGPSHPELAASLINLGVQRTLAGGAAAARPLLERAVAIREAAFGPDHPVLVGALQSLAGLLLILGDNTGGKVLLERAQRIRENDSGADPADTVRTLVNLAILYQETGDYAGARERYERALRLSEQLRNPADLRTLHVLAKSAIALSELGGDFAGAARLNERLVSMTEEAYGPTDPRLTVPLENLAIDRRDLGDYSAAQPLAERSLAIGERAFGPQHPEVASSVHTLATIRAALGDYGEAMRLFERATRINEAALGPSSPEKSRAGWFIRDLLPLSGYDADDLDLFESMLSAREKARGLGDPRTAESLSNLAALLSTPEDYIRTRPLFERALASQERTLGPDHPQVATAASNLAYVLSQSGDRLSARLLYERALRIWEHSLGTDHPKVGTALLNLAGVSSNPTDAGARRLVERALTIQQQRLGAEHPEVAGTLTRLAEIAARTGSPVEAFETAARAEALSREHMRLTARTLSEPEALAYASSRGSSLDLMLSVASGLLDGRQLSTAAWDAVVRARGIVVDELAARHRVVSAAGDRETIALTEALASARQRLAAAVLRGIRDDPPERYRGLLDRARMEKNRAERALAEKSAMFREDQSRSDVGFPDLSAALTAESALVAFVRYQRHTFEGSGTRTTTGPDAEPSYLAFVLRGGDSVPTIVPLGSAAKIEGLILRWQQQLDQEAMAGGRGVKRGEAAYRRAGGELRRQVWDPLRPHLSSAARVFIVPDGTLHLVSFAALPTAAAQYLVETGPLIHYLSAERDLLSAPAPHSGGGLLALGAPAFDAEGVGSAASGSFRGTRATCDEFQSMRFDPLPASLKEVEEVAALWNQAHGDPPGAARLRSAKPSPSHSTRLTGTAATESTVKSEAPGHRVLHLATHGFFLGGRCGSADPPAASTQGKAGARIARQNPLVMSGLVLAGANNRDVAAQDQDDGVLTAEEVASLNLNGVEWAVLSGCDTGVGEVRIGEGVFGLRRAFQVAGARTVIMSLWPVDDETTRQWMTTLYKGRLTKRLSTADAVNEANLWVLRQRRAKGLSAHPFHWAAFVAAGDWR